MGHKSAEIQLKCKIQIGSLTTHFGVSFDFMVLLCGEWSIGLGAHISTEALSQAAVAKICKIDL
jgi:hypothetical protein